MGDPSVRMALSGHQLKWLCEQLLQRRGWAVEASPHDGIDFIARDAEGRRYVVECKAGSSQLQASAIYRLTAQHKLHGTDRALLVTTMTVPARLVDEMQALEIELWSSDTLADAVRSDVELRDGLAQTSPAAIAIAPGQLRIQALEIDGFRGIAQLELPLAERGTTVLAGINGAGKTAVLEALATVLSWVFARLANPDGRGRTISDHDIKLGAKHCTITAHAELDGRPLRWSVVGSRPGTRSRPRPELDEINAAVRAIHEGLEQDQGRPLPVAVMYAVNRAVLDIPRRIRKRHEFDRFSAHEGALAHGGTRDFRTFFEWFRDREDLENERRIQQPEHRDPQLIAVREAIETVLDGVSNLRVRRNPQRMVVDKRGGERGEELIVDQLSDGEKCLLATVGDLARRLAVANPGSPAPLREHGVVLIDEIDLHLHPRWQRSVIPDLERTFPNCQLVVTTHSPQVLSHVKGETIRLTRSDGLTMLERRSVYGWDTNRILEEFLEVDERPREVKQGLDHYFGLIQSGQLEAAQATRERLEGEIGLDEPNFKKADVLLRHRRLLASE